MIKIKYQHINYNGITEYEEFKNSIYLTYTPIPLFNNDEPPSVDNYVMTNEELLKIDTVIINPIFKLESIVVHLCLNFL